MTAVTDVVADDAQHLAVVGADANLASTASTGLRAKGLPGQDGSATSPPLVAPVAQLDRAPDYGSGGWEFESLRARH